MSQQPMWPGVDPGYQNHTPMPPQQQGPPQWAGQPQAQPQQGWGGAPQQPQIPSGPVDESADYFTRGQAGPPAFDFGGADEPPSNPPRAVQGIVVEAVKRQQTDIDTGQPLTFDDGSPRMQLVVTLQTALRNWEGARKIPEGDNGQPKPPHEDDGKRRIFVKFKMEHAVQDALRAAGHTGGIVGGLLGVAYTGKDGRAKTYMAKFVPAGQHQGLPPAAAPQQAPQQAPPPGQFNQGAAAPQAAPQLQQRPHSGLPGSAPQQPPAAPPQGDNAWGGYTPPQQPGQGLPQPPAGNPFGGQAPQYDTPPF